MNDKSDPSDDDNIDNDDNDSDFNIEDCQDDVDSDDSSERLTASTNNGDEHTGDRVLTADDCDDEEYDDDDEDDKEYVGPLLPGGHRFDKKYICIKYPGNVVNPENAIETLGGITAISTAVNTRNRRLELRFRPDDGYCKPACGDRHATTGFLLRIKIKRKNIRNAEGDTEIKKTSSEVLEVINLGTTRCGDRDDETESSGKVTDNSDTGWTDKSSPSSKRADNSKTEIEVENLLNELAHRIEDGNVQTENESRDDSGKNANTGKPHKTDSDIDAQVTQITRSHDGAEASEGNRIENVVIHSEVDPDETCIAKNIQTMGSHDEAENSKENELENSETHSDVNSDEIRVFGETIDTSGSIHPSIDTKLNASSDEGNKSKESIFPPFEKNKCEDLSEDRDYELPELKVLGQVDTEFKFMNLCDFQYLPITPKINNPRENECIYEAIYPVNVPPYRWLKNKVPYFLPPAAFSRMDNVQQYVPKTETDTLPENVIGKTRKRRAGFSNFIHFHAPDVPMVPPKGIENAMKVKFLQTFHLERVRRLFEQRPIWSKNALMFETKFNGDQLKILLPSVAYYFMTGPWRIMWVKLGYDPRKDPTARKYQTLDYRLKAMHGLESTVKCKRSYSNYILPYKSAPTSKPRTTVLTANLTEQSQKKEKHLNENVYVYREGMVPPSRQMFYQYCDVLVDEVQEMLAKLPDPTAGSTCHEKMGWLPNGFDDQCREIINKQVRGVLRKQMNIPEDHPTTLPRKRKFGTKLRFGRLKNKRSKKSHLLNPDSSSIHMEVIPEGSDEEWEDDTGSCRPSTSRDEL